MKFHENRLPADDSCEISCLICYYEKVAKLEIVVCCKLKVVLYGLILHHRVNTVMIVKIVNNS